MPNSSGRPERMDHYMSPSQPTLTRRQLLVGTAALATAAVVPERSWAQAGRPSLAVGPSPLLSLSAPRFVSAGTVTALNSGDGFAWEWNAPSAPAWMAYDLSGVPAAKRQSVLVTLLNRPTYPYLSAGSSTVDALPSNYTIEASSAAGGGQPPNSGWRTIATITGNTRSQPHHVVNLAASNWIRVFISSSSNGPVTACVDLFAQPNGTSDDWLFMGDSITLGGLYSGYSRSLAGQVNAIDTARFPAIVNAAMGATSTLQAQTIIDATLAQFPGTFIALGYGTNDSPGNYRLESLIQKVLSAGKVPVVPRMPWSSTDPLLGVSINAIIDQLLVEYPSVVHGPDLYAAFYGRTDLIPQGDVHPNDAGNVVLRKQWARAMTSLNLTLAGPVSSHGIRGAVRLGVAG